MMYRRWIAALLSLAIICTALAVMFPVAAGQANACPQGCQCHQGGPCSCQAGACDNAMCPNSPGYSYNPGSNGFFPTTMPQFPGGEPRFPGPINRTPVNRTMPSPTSGPYPTMYPQPGIMPGMPMPTIGPGMPTQFPGMPFPGSPTATPVPTVAPTPVPTPIVMPP